MKGTTVSVVLSAVFFFFFFFIGSFDRAESAPVAFAKPSNCRTLECPAYSVVATTKEFEIREYEPAVWMSTPPIKSFTYDDAANRGFMTLFSYIGGNNNQRENVEMTAPVLVDIQPSKAFFNSTYVVHFYVPKKYQSNPPTSSQVSPVKLPSTKYVAVKRFGGFLNQLQITDEVANLKKSLAGTVWKSAVGRNGTGYSVAGYNSPFEFSGRVNEVWIPFEANK